MRSRAAWPGPVDDLGGEPADHAHGVDVVAGVADAADRRPRSSIDLLTCRRKRHPPPPAPTHARGPYRRQARVGCRF
jgi:hypothetical protein